LDPWFKLATHLHVSVKIQNQVTFYVSFITTARPFIQKPGDVSLVLYMSSTNGIVVVQLPLSKATRYGRDFVPYCVSKKF